MNTKTDIELADEALADYETNPRYHDLRLGGMSKLTAMSYIATDHVNYDHFMLNLIPDQEPSTTKLTVAQSNLRDMLRHKADSAIQKGDYKALIDISVAGKSEKKGCKWKSPTDSRHINTLVTYHDSNQHARFQPYYERLIPKLDHFGHVDDFLAVVEAPGEANQSEGQLFSNVLKRNAPLLGIETYKNKSSFINAFETGRTGIWIDSDTKNPFKLKKGIDLHLFHKGFHYFGEHKIIMGAGGSQNTALTDAKRNDDIANKKIWIPIIDGDRWQANKTAFNNYVIDPLFTTINSLVLLRVIKDIVEDKFDVV